VCVVWCFLWPRCTVIHPPQRGQRFAPAFLRASTIFTGVRETGVLGSSLLASNAQATPKIVYLSDTAAPMAEYAINVTDKGTP
jgi:hypothetical protein